MLLTGKSASQQYKLNQLLHFHGNKGFTNDPQCNVKHTLTKICALPKGQVKYFTGHAMKPYHRAASIHGECLITNNSGT